MKMSNRTYDVLKYIALCVLPPLATFYAVIAKIWSLPFAAEIPGTIMAVDTLLGAMLKISTDKYNQEGQAQPPEEEKE